MHKRTSRFDDIDEVYEITSDLETGRVRVQRDEEDLYEGDVEELLGTNQWLSHGIRNAMPDVGLDTVPAEIIGLEVRAHFEIGTEQDRRPAVTARAFEARIEGLDLMAEVQGTQCLVPVTKEHALRLHEATRGRIDVKVPDSGTTGCLTVR